MKVTAIIDDSLIEEIRKATGGKNITDSITIALEAYLKQYNVSNIINDLAEQPLVFAEEYTAYKVRENNRKR